MQYDIESLKKMLFQEIYIKELCFENITNYDFQHEINMYLSFVYKNECSKVNIIKLHNAVTDILCCSPFYDPIGLSVESMKEYGYETSSYSVVDREKKRFTILFNEVEINQKKIDVTDKYKMKRKMFTNESDFLQNKLQINKYLKKVRYIYNKNKTTDIILNLTSDEYMIDNDDIIIKFNSATQISLSYFQNAYKMNLRVLEAKKFNEKYSGLYWLSDETDGQTVIEFMFETYELLS